MSITALEAFNAAMALIDEVGSDGVINDADYIKQAPYIINMLQAELAKVGDVYTTFEFANKPIENILKEGFVNIEVNNETKSFVGSGQAKAYYFKANRSGTAYIEDYTGSWNTLATVTINGGTDKFTEYAGVVTPTTGATQSRIRLVSSYRFLIRDLALYEESFSSSSDVPAWGRYVKKTMPSDFKSLDTIVNESDMVAYEKQSIIKWEGKNSLYINSTFDGYIRIIYKPILTTITALSQTLQIDDDTATKILPYGLAAQLMIHDDKSKASFFQQRYEELTRMATKKQPVGETQLTDVYFLDRW